MRNAGGFTRGRITKYSKRVSFAKKDPDILKKIVPGLSPPLRRPFSGETLGRRLLTKGFEGRDIRIGLFPYFYTN